MFTPWSLRQKPQPTEIKADKGQYQGSCNRTACQRPGATVWNVITQAYYCRQCGREINHWNTPEKGGTIVHETNSYVMCVPVEHPAHPHYKAPDAHDP